MKEGKELVFKQVVPPEEHRHVFMSASLMEEWKARNWELFLYSDITTKNTIIEIWCDRLGPLDLPELRMELALEGCPCVVQ